MAKNTVTRATALTAAIAALTEQGKTAEVEVLNKMLVSITKPREKSVSKARLQNENLAAQVRDALTEGVSVDGKWLQEHVAFLTSPQKVSAVMRVAAELGYTVTERDGRNVTYKLA